MAEKMNENSKRSKIASIESASKVRRDSLQKGERTKLDAMSGLGSGSSDQLVSILKTFSGIIKANL